MLADPIRFQYLRSLATYYSRQCCAIVDDLLRQTRNLTELQLFLESNISSLAAVFCAIRSFHNLPRVAILCTYAKAQVKAFVRYFGMHGVTGRCSRDAYHCETRLDLVMYQQ